MNQPTESKTYLPGAQAKEITFTSGKTILKLNVNAQLTAQWLLDNANERGYVTLGISPLKPENVTDRRTHSVWLDSWKPTPGQDRPAQAQKGPAKASEPSGRVKTAEARKPEPCVADDSEVPF